MSYFETDDGAAAKPRRPEESVGFAPLFPSETRGDGKLRANNKESGGLLGSGSFKKKVSCSNCGFMLDLNRDDVSGGSDSGNGAGGRIAVETVSLTQPGGETYTEYSPDQSFAKGGGCPMCFSKNGSKNRPEDVSETPSAGPSGL